MKNSKALVSLFSLLVVSFGFTFAGCSQKSDEEVVAEEVAGSANDAAKMAEDAAKDAEKNAEALKAEAESALKK